jgi:hypothetical protein
MHFTRWRSQGTGGAWSWTPPGIGKRWPLGVGCETIWCSGVARTDPDNNDVDTLVEIASTPLLGYNLSPWISRFSLLRQGSARWPIMTRILKLRVGTRIPENQTLVSTEFKAICLFGPDGLGGFLGDRTCLSGKWTCWPCKSITCWSVFRLIGIRQLGCMEQKLS